MVISYKEGLRKTTGSWSTSLCVPLAGRASTARRCPGSLRQMTTLCTTCQRCRIWSRRWRLNRPGKTHIGVVLAFLRGGARTLHESVTRAHTTLPHSWILTFGLAQCSNYDRELYTMKNYHLRLSLEILDILGLNWTKQNISYKAQYHFSIAPYGR